MVTGSLNRRGHHHCCEIFHNHAGPWRRAAPKAQGGLMRRSAGSKDEVKEPQNTLAANRHSFDRKMG
nr:MAG TPA: hypothetical protein [Caudoviricetes sp.]